MNDYREPQASSSATKAKILVVDDEPDIVRAVTLRLRSAGYDVLTANDGAMATQTAIRERPDLVIMDIGMPCGDGYTVAQRLASNANTLITPVVFLSARTSPEDQERAKELGAVDFVTKPFTPERLLGAVRNALASAA